MNDKEKIAFIKQNCRFVFLCDKEQGDKERFQSDWFSQIEPIIPKRLFKYRKCNNDNISALKNRKAWFSCPSFWDDRADATVRFDFESELKKIDENFDDHVIDYAAKIAEYAAASLTFRFQPISENQIREAYHSAYEGKAFISDKAYKYLVPNIGPDAARKVTMIMENASSFSHSEGFKENVQKCLRQFMGLNQIREHAKAFSACEAFDNNSMWVQYADKGRGFCIGYEIKPKTAEEHALVRGLLPIVYDERPKMMISELVDAALFCLAFPKQQDAIILKQAQQVALSFYTKESCWSGEEEWRFATHSEGINGGLIDFNFAESLYFGEKILPYWRKRLIKIAQEQHLDVFQRSFNDLEKSWRYDKIDIDS